LCEANVERLFLRRVASTLIVALLFAGLLTQTSATGATAPRITRAAKIQSVINTGVTAVVTPALANLKATRKYVWYVDGRIRQTSTSKTFRTTAAHTGAKLYALEYLKFDSKRTLTSRSNTVVVGALDPYLWNQEFNEAAGSGVDTNSFDLFSDYALGDGSMIWNPGWGNNERQWYTPSNAQTDGVGNLVLKARKALPSATQQCYYGKCTWTSAKLVTLGKVGFKYGRIEIRAKISGGRGQWPALWMLGANQPQVNWPQCGEIDIAEWKGDLPNQLWGTLHGPNYLNRGNTTTISGGFTGYHLYRIDWVENKISWYLDGVKFHEMTANSIGGNEWVFNTEQYLILNVAMGGNFVGNSISSSLTETSMSVDYIRFSKIDGVGSLIRH
jgi:beta-glucanase (GH16 family)